MAKNHMKVMQIENIETTLYSTKSDFINEYNLAAHNDFLEPAISENQRDLLFSQNQLELPGTTRLFNTLTLPNNLLVLAQYYICPKAQHSQPRPPGKMRKIVMLGAGPRTQRSASSVQLPTDFSPVASSVPTFHYTTDEFIFDLRTVTEEESNGEESNHKKTLREMLHARWEDARDSNAFNYSLNCMYKFLEGQYNLSIQLNVERGELRRKPMRFKHIREPFNNIRWNFTKLHENEMMFYMKCEDVPISTDPLDRHVVAVNASPLERDHSLIVPSLNKCLPQILTNTAIRLATDMMLLVDDDSFHILFNSLLGLASVNHLHMHCLYWPYDSDLINRKFEMLSDVPDAYVIRPPDWLCHAFAFQLPHKEKYEVFMRNITQCVEHLTAIGQAHNVFFTRAQPIRLDGPVWEEDKNRERAQLVTAYVFPRTNLIGAKPPTNFNPAANELAGCLTSYTVRFFEAASEQAAVRIIEEEAQLSDDEFNRIYHDVSDVLSNRVVGSSCPNGYNLLDGLTSPEIDELRDQFQSYAPHSPHHLRRERTNSADDIVSPVKFTFTGC